jgi:hypothetical protein
VWAEFDHLLAVSESASSPACPPRPCAGKSWPSPPTLFRGARRRQARAVPQGCCDASRRKGARGRADKKGGPTLPFTAAPQRTCWRRNASLARSQRYVTKRSTGLQHDACRGGSTGIPWSVESPRIPGTTALSCTHWWQGPRSTDAARLGPAGSHQRQMRVVRLAKRRGTPERLWGARARVQPFVPLCAVGAWGMQVWGFASYGKR